MSWIETKEPQENDSFQHLSEITQPLLKAFSTDDTAIGVTTTEDVVWWMREKIRWYEINHLVSIQPLTYNVMKTVIYMLTGSKKLDVILPGILLPVI